MEEGICVLVLLRSQGLGEGDYCAGNVTEAQSIQGRGVVSVVVKGLHAGSPKYPFPLRDLSSKPTRSNISWLRLRGSDLSQFSVRQRLSWAENRNTKREEDQAYSLLGMFEVHLPLIYGEGMKNALHRLLEEIDKRAHPSPRSALSKQSQNTVVMPRNDFFFGREDILHQLHQDIGPNEGENFPRQKSCVLNGLGGSGKTQIALEYTYRYRDPYQYIFWLCSESAPELAEKLQQNCFSAQTNCT